MKISAVPTPIQCLVPDGLSQTVTKDFTDRNHYIDTPAMTEISSSCSRTQSCNIRLFAKNR